ncbi:MAG: hypothetical protein ACYC9L_13255 [Sulfuricaulis sp.]
MPPTVASASPCRVCAIAAGAQGTSHVDNAWLRNERFAAFVSVGALVSGWSLVAPRDHSLNLATSYCDAGFLEFVAQAHRILTATYGHAVVFEHGCQDETSATSCGTVHAHLHMVPLSFALTTASCAFDRTMRWQSCRAIDVQAIAVGSEYLFVADRFEGRATSGLASVLDEGRSQFFRKVIASKINRAAEFDYRVHPQRDVGEASSRRLSDAARNTQDVAIAA